VVITVEIARAAHYLFCIICLDNLSEISSLSIILYITQTENSLIKNKLCIYGILLHTKAIVDILYLNVQREMCQVSDKNGAVLSQICLKLK
jgi:hypothetical protein